MSDTSSGVGVCASCLREKLFPILVAQSDTHPTPSIFPRSVSPPHVIKSDDQNRLFHDTPQLGPTGSIPVPKGEKTGFSVFGSRLKKPGLDCAATSSPPASWFSGLFSGREKNQSHVNEPAIGGGQGRGSGRGMSPEVVSDCVGEDGHDGGESSGYSSAGRRAVPAAVRGKGGRGLGSRDVAGFAFFLSPLVRARPKRGRSSKSMRLNVAITSVKPQPAAAVGFCKNRSRKIADFGRIHLRQ